MIFPNATQLTLSCDFEQIVAGALHPDGRRYLPLLIFRLPRGTPESITTLGVVDRHHRIDTNLVGCHGTTRIVLLLSALRVLKTPRTGFFDPTLPEGRASTMPEVYGQVVSVPTWETGAGQLPYETLYTEFLLDVGIGIVGVRTSTTAISLNSQLGKQQIEPGDWVAVSRSRIDILGFTVDD
jgi:hypothetical protein